VPGPGAAAGAKAASAAAGRVSAGAASRSGAAQAAKQGGTAAAGRSAGAGGTGQGAAGGRGGGGARGGGGGARGGGHGSSLGRLVSIRAPRGRDREDDQALVGSTGFRWIAIGGGALAFFVLVIVAPLALFEASGESCGGSEDEAVPIQTNHKTDPEDLSETQIEIRIYLVGQVMHMTPRQIVTAYDVGFVESTMHNIHWGGEGSTGVFQQRNFSPWTDGGRNRNNVIDASISFFLRLRELDNGQPIPVLAQDVQVSAYPERYYDWVDDGVETYNRIKRLVGTPAGVKSIKSLEGITIGSGGIGACALTGNGTYVNPFEGQSWTPERTDQGVDYATSHNYPIRAIGNAEMMSTGSWGKYGPFAWYKLLDGPQQGHCVFVAEGIQNILPAGTVVRAGGAIARSIPNWQYGIETGWAQGEATPSTPYNGAPDGTPMPGGKAFNRFLLSLGAETREHWGPGPVYAGASC
jgi:hypothetical protein